MDSLMSMFRVYMRDYGCDAVVNGELVTRIFFKEIKDSSGYKDSKYLYAYNGEVKQGDSIEVNGCHWLVVQEDVTYQKQYTRFIVVEAIHNINFVIDESLYSTIGLVDAGSQSADRSKLSVIDGKIMLVVQDNESTSKVKTNDRVIKFNQAWKIIATTKESKGLINIYCESDVFLSTDDKENEIPSGVASWGISFAESTKEMSLDSTLTLEPIITKNGGIVTSGFELEWAVSDDEVISVANGVVESIAVGVADVSVTLVNRNVSATVSIEVVNAEVVEYRITPNDRIVYSLMGATDFRVDKVVNGVVVPDTFTITAYGLTTSQYTLQVVNGNDFRLTSKGYTANKLTVRCVSGSTGYIHEEQFSMYTM